MFFVRKGFGFIKPDDGEEEIFVHHSAIKGEGFTSLADSEEVEYELENCEETGKLRAVNVTGRGGAAVQGGAGRAGERARARNADVRAAALGPSQAEVWAAKKSFKNLKFKLKFPIARISNFLGLVLGWIEANICK